MAGEQLGGKRLGWRVRGRVAPGRHPAHPQQIQLVGNAYLFGNWRDRYSRNRESVVLSVLDGNPIILRSIICCIFRTNKKCSQKIGSSTWVGRIMHVLIYLAPCRSFGERVTRPIDAPVILSNISLWFTSTLCSFSACCSSMCARPSRQKPKITFIERISGMPDVLYDSSPPRGWIHCPLCLSRLVSALAANFRSRAHLFRFFS